MSSVYTYVTEIKNSKHNDLLMNYITDYKVLFNKIQRITFYRIKKAYITKDDFTLQDKENLVKYIASSYNLTTRASNSIVTNMIGRFNAIKELKQYEKEQLEFKISSLEGNISRLEDERNKLNLKMSLNVASKKEQVKYKNLKISLYWKRNKLNKTKQKLSNIEHELTTHQYKICFGTKHLLKTNYAKFIEQRDSELFYIGRAAETCCNANFQMTYNQKDNQFHLRIRKEIDLQNDKYVEGKVYFNQKRTKELKQILSNKMSPLTYRIKVKNGKYYLYVIFQYEYKKSMCITRNNNGVIGVDFNKGFVAVSETDKYGNLINSFNLNYRFGKGNKTTSDFQLIAKHLSECCLASGKDLIIENLNFNKKKGNMVKGQYKKYNEMLSTLACAKFSQIIESKCAKTRIYLKKVNPAWTSYIAKMKYCNKMKLNIHTGASYVIARRGQGFKDKVNKKTAS